MNLVHVTDDGCWRWTRIRNTKNDPYGLYFDGRTHLPGRLSWSWWCGELDPTKNVVSMCGRRMCVNPFHLIQVKVGVEMWKALGECSGGHKYEDSMVGIRPSTGESYCMKCNSERSQLYKSRKKARRDAQTRVA